MPCGPDAINLWEIPSATCYTPLTLIAGIYPGATTFPGATAFPSPGQVLTGNDAVCEWEIPSATTYCPYPEV